MSYSLHSIFLVVLFHLFLCLLVSLFFFFNDTATTEIYTLSLHDALPICGNPERAASRRPCSARYCLRRDPAFGLAPAPADAAGRVVDPPHARCHLAERHLRLFRRTRIRPAQALQADLAEQDLGGSARRGGWQHRRSHRRPADLAALGPGLGRGADRRRRRHPRSGRRSVGVDAQARLRREGQRDPAARPWRPARSHRRAALQCALCPLVCTPPYLTVLARRAMHI